MKLKNYIIIDKIKVSKDLKYHIVNDIPLHENVFRMGSEKYFKIINETRILFNRGMIGLTKVDSDLVSSDIGKKIIIEGKEIYLDIPFSEEDMLSESEYKGRKVKLNKPKRGGSKKFYVYVRNPKTDRILKVSFGAKSGGGKLAVKLRDPKARAAFAKRHNCEKKNDKTKPGYWACRLPRYAKSLGLSGGGKWW